MFGFTKPTARTERNSIQRLGISTQDRMDLISQLHLYGLVGNEIGVKNQNLCLVGIIEVIGVRY